MRLLSIFFFFTGMSLHCVTAGAQWVVTDPGNTAQGIINAANTASTVKQTVEQVNRLQTALDYVQKVSATVRRARMFTDLIDRQNRLNSNCLRTLEEAEKMDMKGLPGITSAVQDVVANNAAIISLTSPGGFTGHHQTDHVTYAYHQTEFGTCNGIGIWHQ